MKNRLKQLYQKLGLNKDNGLFYLSDADFWVHKFPYRISRILKDVIKPDAFFCLYQNNSETEDNHPKPFNQSFILFFDNPDNEKEDLIHKQVINFGLAQVVFICKPDTLDIYHGNDTNSLDLKKLRSLNDCNLDDFTFINLIRGNVYKSIGERKNTIDKYLLKNITDARRILVAKDGLNLLPKAANRLIGRLLFVSYLIDRNVTFSDQSFITGENKLERKESFRNLILKKDDLYGFFNYLTHKYNGDMFPLFEENGLFSYYEIENINDDHLKVLYNLFTCSSFFSGGKKFGTNYVVQQSLFDLYDFEIIPVELISSIYESFIGNSDENDDVELSKQKDIKAYYTPSYIVDYILSQTVSPFLENEEKLNSDCKVLDPSCGSGIFLVETVRKIIEKELFLIGNKTLSDSRLWRLIKSNIYGIDIDSDAIDITIFSLYITILDYKQPAEIERFRFEKLREENLFGGLEADFFNTNHPFNTIIQNVDFIIGNPPWGNIPNSNYNNYIKDRNARENKGKAPADRLALQIGGKEICQAFLIRSSDFATKQKAPKCSFVVSSKVLYNTGKTSKNFRNYFLSKYNIHQVVELSPVNNKLRGGNHIFENARYPAAIITYIPEKNNGNTSKNVIQHITVKPNSFFLHYKTILVEKHDVKRIKQEYFMERLGGIDWLWKTLVYGNVLDVHLIKKLKNKKLFKTAKEYFAELGYEQNGGLKLKDGVTKKDASHLLDHKFLDAKNEFRPYFAMPNKSFRKYLELENNTDSRVGYLPSQRYFEGDKLLFKKGVVLKNLKYDEHLFGAVTAFNTEKVTFTSTVGSLISTNKHVDSSNFLSALSSIFNSKLFTYFTLNTGASLGVEKSRINFDEFEKFPIVIDNELSTLSKEIVININNPEVVVDNKRKIEKLINRLYNLDEEEQALVDYSMNVSIPLLLREKKSIIFKPLNLNIANDELYIVSYINVFTKFFKSRFDKINKSLQAEVSYTNEFLRINFKIESKQSIIIKPNKDNVDLLGDLGIYEVCKNLYFQQDVRGFTSTSFYIIKPNERKLWHKAVAYLDALEFEEEIVKAEMKTIKVAL
ncbi:Eco57I restriction-modification methylase domain-containing protein [Marinifilum sp.]|uniref:Eco57I restriction-modification methylase domain-containing protein n=1 Tax=Marinifilum sp. TaxID=2033137 RepID=UPI003BADA18B